jgi:hypothetical protein
MQRYFLLLLLAIALVTCKRDPVIETGDLFIEVKYDGAGEDHTEVWLYESWYKFDRYEYLEKQFSNDYGEVLFIDLEPGWYVVEARKEKSSLFIISAADSVEVVANRQINKILIMEPESR